MVARAQSLDCYTCEDVNLVTEVRNTCDVSKGFIVCKADEVCSSVTMTFTTEANGTPMDNYYIRHKCMRKGTEDSELVKCWTLESDLASVVGGLKDYVCKLATCEDNLCNKGLHKKKSGRLNMFVSIYQAHLAIRSP